MIQYPAAPQKPPHWSESALLLPLLRCTPPPCPASFWLFMQLPAVLIHLRWRKRKGLHELQSMGKPPKMWHFQERNAECMLLWETVFKLCWYSVELQVLSWNVHWMRRVKSYKWHFYGPFQGPHNRSSDSTSRCPSSSVTPTLSMSPFTASINLLHL